MVSTKVEPVPTLVDRPVVTAVAAGGPAPQRVRSVESGAAVQVHVTCVGPVAVHDNWIDCVGAGPSVVVVVVGSIVVDVGGSWAGRGVGDRRATVVGVVSDVGAVTVVVVAGGSFTVTVVVAFVVVVVATS